MDPIGINSVPGVVAPRHAGCVLAATGQRVRIKCNRRTLRKRLATVGLCQFESHLVLKRACSCDVREVSHEQLATHGNVERWEEREVQCNKQLQEGQKSPVNNNGVICSHVWKHEANNFKCKFKWEIVLEQPWRELVPRLQNSDQGWLRGPASCEIVPLGDWVLSGSWGVALAEFEHGVLPRVLWHDLGPTGTLVECGIPYPSGCRRSECLGLVGSLDPGGG